VREPRKARGGFGLRWVQDQRFAPNEQTTPPFSCRMLFGGLWRRIYKHILTPSPHEHGLERGWIHEMGAKRQIIGLSKKEKDYTQTHGAFRVKETECQNVRFTCLQERSMGHLQESGRDHTRRDFKKRRIRLDWCFHLEL